MKLKEDINPLLLHVFRSAVWVYSVITFIPWYFFSGAGSNLKRARRIKARSVSGPAGPYRAINSEEKLVAWQHPGVDTLDKMFEYAAERFPQRDCLGTREVLSEEDELQPNGKVFKKVRDADRVPVAPNCLSPCFIIILNVWSFVRSKGVFKCYRFTESLLVPVRLPVQSATVHSVRNVGGRAAVLLVLCLTAESLLINTCIVEKAL